MKSKFEVMFEHFWFRFSVIWFTRITHQSMKIEYTVYLFRIVSTKWFQYLFFIYLIHPDYTSNYQNRIAVLGLSLNYDQTALLHSSMQGRLHSMPLYRYNRVLVSDSKKWKIQNDVWLWSTYETVLEHKYLYFELCYLLMHIHIYQTFCNRLSNYMHIWFID